MMKKYKLYISILFIASLAFSSCSDWLYIEPEDGVTVDQFWQTERDVHAAVMGCYASMLGGTTHPVAEAMFNWGELRADMIRSFRSINNDFEQINQGEILPTNNFARWNGFYTTINLCNTVLEFGPKVVERDGAFTQARMNEYKGEVLGLRALLYFYLARVFNEVPLVLEATTTDSRIQARTKASNADIFAQIISDLEEAERLIPRDHGRLEENKGRINYYTIKAIQADVYLWLDEFDKVIEACDEIIQSGQFALVPGNENWFTTLFVEGNSIESIFELQFSSEILNPYYNWVANVQWYRANTLTVEYLWPVNILALPEDADIRSDGAAYRSADGYSIWKYIGANREQRKPFNEATSNWIVYRYADILLMKAEALANTNQGAQALTYIDVIRDRANAPDDTYQSPTGQFGLTSYILDERGREFAYEGKRWFDILRNAKRNNYQRLDLLTDMAIRSTRPEKIESLINKLRDTDFHYLPIHQSEINAGYPHLKQNPFYDQTQR
ncbi:RagB/SusD family nutrient uptake outer membrane protein [Alkalitalea saponilacus]|nr:RagB/SusD family nutrient uptake outer membrane protein [Alkalitalea saponilacus]